MLRPLLTPLFAAALLLTAARCAGPEAGNAAPEATAPAVDPPSGPIGASVSPADPDTALFAAGCFWCAETAYEGRDGVVEVVSGFAGGTVPNPTYDQVTRGGTGHYEVILVVYEPDVISYERLLEIFWRNVDPFQSDGQFCDIGPSYRAAVFPLDAAQRRLAEASLAEVETLFSEPAVTEILGAAPFYPAEDYHQDFWRKDPDRYYSYRTGCGRDARLEALWGDEAGADPAIDTH